MKFKHFLAFQDIIFEDLEIEECYIEGETFRFLKNTKDALRLLEIRLSDGSSLYTIPNYLYRVYNYGKNHMDEERLRQAECFFLKTCDCFGKNTVKTFICVENIMYIRLLPVFIDKKDIVKDL